VSPDQIRDMDTKRLALRAIEALGVNSRDGKPSAAHIMEHSIAQACLELEVVEQILENDQDRGNMAYIVAGIRQRLEMAQHSASFLATILAGAANG